MGFTAERCLKLADCYEKMAEHERAPKAIRLLFARKANLFRISARLAALNETQAQQADAGSAVGLIGERAQAA